MNRAIQMHRSHKIDGTMVSFRRSIVGWVACFGPDRCVHFRQPLKGGRWVAKRPAALEPLAVADSLADAVRMVHARYVAEDIAAHEAAYRRLMAALAEVQP